VRQRERVFGPGRRPGRLRAEQVGLSAQLPGQLLQVVEGQSERQGVPDRVPHPGPWVVRQLVVEPAAEALVEVERGLDLVPDREPRRQPGLEWEGAQQRPGEGVDRLDRGQVDLAGRLRAAVADGLAARGVGGGRPQLAPDAAPQLGRGRLGERDRGQALHLQAAVGDQRDDPRHELARLARPGAGLDQEGAVEVAGYPGAVGAVGERRRLHGGHAFSPPGSASRR
jgi:hypothetical protein